MSDGVTEMTLTPEAVTRYMQKNDSAAEQPMHTSGNDINRAERIM